MLQFLFGKIDGRTVTLTLSFFKIVKGIPADVAFFLAPVKESPEVLHDAGDGIAAALVDLPRFRLRLQDAGVFFHNLVFMAFR